MARKKEIEINENIVAEKENTAETDESTVVEKESTAETDKSTVAEKAAPKYELSFSKQAFLSSKSYKSHRDLLETILENGKGYTKSEVNKLIDNYLKGKVI